MRRTIKLLFAAVAILAVLCTGAAFAATENGVPYLDGSGNKKTQDGVTVISEATQNTLDTKKLDQAWYVVRGHPKFTDPLWFTNTSGVNIILEDGATLEVSYTAESGTVDSLRKTISAGHSMTIYAQSTDRETMGCISADRMLIGSGGSDWGNNEALYVDGPLSIQGGMIKARATAPTGDITALIASGDITVEAHAVLEVDSSSSGPATGTQGIYCKNFVSSGDVTLTTTATGSASSVAIAIDPVDGARIVGGAFRATAVSASGDDYAAGVSSSGGRLIVEGGWVETHPDNYQQHDDIKTTITYTAGALIVGDTGTVKKTAVIPAGMTATPRDGVTLTFEQGAKLTVEQGAKLDASKATLANAANKIANDGVLVLPDSMTKEQIKALKITDTGRIYWRGKLIHADGTRNYIDDIAEASKKFADEPSAWRPENGEWEIVITPDDDESVAAVSIDGDPLEEDAEWSIKAASLGGISAKAETPRTVVISAATLSALVDEGAPSSHDLRIMVTDEGYADLTFWVGTEKLPMKGSSGACAAGAAAMVAIAALAVIKRRKR